MYALMLVIALTAALGIVPFMYKGSLQEQQQFAQADVIARGLVVRYQAALSLCHGQPTPLDCQSPTYVDLDPSLVLPQGIAHVPFFVTAFDGTRVIAYIDESRADSAKQPLWGEVSAALMRNSNDAKGVEHPFSARYAGAYPSDLYADAPPAQAKCRSICNRAYAGAN